MDSQELEFLKTINTVIDKNGVCCLFYGEQEEKARYMWDEYINKFNYVNLGKKIKMAELIASKCKVELYYKEYIIKI